MERKRRKKKTRLEKGFLLKWIYISVIIIMVVQGVRQQPLIDANKQKIIDIQQQIEYEKQRAAEVDAWTAKVDTDEYIEKVARTKLGLVKSNEKIFIDASKSNQ